MRRIKRAVTISVMIIPFFIAVTVFAQMEELRNTTPDQRAKIETMFMKIKLNLAPQQMKMVHSINLKYAKQMDPVIKGSGRKLRKVRQASMINQAKDQEMQTALSPEQYQGYLASKEEMRQRIVEKIKAKRSSTG